MPNKGVMNAFGAGIWLGRLEGRQLKQWSWNMTPSERKLLLETARAVSEIKCTSGLLKAMDAIEKEDRELREKAQKSTDRYLKSILPKDEPKPEVVWPGRMAGTKL